MPQDAKIRLDKSRIRSLNFKIKEGVSKGQAPISYKISYGYEYNYKEKSINVLMSVSIGENQLPFLLDIEYEGLFKLDKRVAKKKIEPFAEINCPAILFPFLRECIADITRRAGFNPLILPAINFVGLVKKQKAKKKPRS